MKKVIATIFSLLLLFMQISYAEEIFTDYDFSDAAQEEFDRAMQEPINIQPESELKLKRERKTKHEVIIEDEIPIEIEEQRNLNYTLPEIQGTNLPYQGNIMTIPQGEIIAIRLKSDISAGSLDRDDNLTAELARDWVYNNRLIAPRGSLVYGVVVDAEAAGAAYGPSVLEIMFNSVMTSQGTGIDIQTEKLRFEHKSERAQKVSTGIVVGAGLGLLVGLAWGACTGDMSVALLSAGVLGAGMGGAWALQQRGHDVSVGADTVIELILTEPVNVIPYIEL